jgi:RimJ/RimL family protein N-acetyltransferase
MDITAQRITGEQLILEPLQASHCEGLFTAGQQADDWLYMPRPCFKSLADTRDWVDKALALAKQKAHITYTIIDRQSATIFGSTRLLAIRPEHRGLEIGYTWLGREFQRSRVNTEAKLLLLQHCFETLHCIRVELKTDLRNRRSQTAIERIGAVKEGVLRQHMIAQEGHLRDTVYYSIIDADWPGVKKQLSARLTDN